MIKVLDDKTINKIAAGEVVERPAAIVKEVVENAIDAEASDLRIDLEAGGKRLIRIRDNGFGMDRRDAELCLQRHATSKIRTDSDLFSVTSLGFRGEAIPSIAAVSRFEILTRHSESPIGTRAVVEGGNLVEVVDAGCPLGTQITARNLFYNVPARRKFLRTDSTELSHCLEAVVRQALIRPWLDLEVSHNRSQIIRAPKVQSLKQRAAQLLTNAGRSLIPISFEVGSLSLTGLVSPVGVHRSTSQNNSYLYVNGRYVKDPALRRAVRDAYKGLVPIGRHPTVVLRLEVPPADVDVNVHPAKTEVRFRFIKELSIALSQGIRDALQSQGIKVVAPQKKAAPLPLYTEQTGLVLPPMPSGSAVQWKPEVRRAPALPNFIASEKTAVQEVPPSIPGAVPSRPTPTADSPGELLDKRQFPDSVTNIDEQLVRSVERKLPLPEPSPLDAGALPWPQIENIVELQALLPVPCFADLAVIGQMGETYILCEGGGELVIIDQHAAHERINLYKLMQRDSSSVLGQRLLTPQIIELSPQRYHGLVPNLDILHQYGFELEEFGDSSLALKQVPQSMLGADYQQMVEEVADDVSQGGGGAPIHDKIQRILATRACHSSIRAGDRLSPFQMREILVDLDGVDFSVCAHGRPVAIRISHKELERRFHRN
jgi:DNA mismatch repair protein MutL